MHDNKCEISVIPAAIDVSFHIALGITIVFNPNGIAKEQIVHTYSVCESSKNEATNIKISGIITSLIIEII